MTAALLALTLLVVDLESGPKPGGAVAALTVTVAVGPDEGKELDAAKDRGDKPTVYVFVNADKWSRPLARFLKTLDGKVGDTTDGGVVAVWVGGDAAKNKEYLPKPQASLNFAKTVLAVSAVEEPKGWLLNADAHATAVVAVRGKVVKSFPLVSVSDKDAAAVLAELTKAAGK